MTKQEAVYWKKFILKVIEEKLPTIKTSDEDAKAISEFAQHHMQTITGQQMLPQSVFRKFLEIFGHIPAIQEEINKAMEELDAWLHNLPEECTVAEIYAMFDEYVCPLRLDADGYIVLTDLVTIDDEGYIVLPSPALDIERYLLVLND